MTKLLAVLTLCVLIFSSACTYKAQFESSDSSLGNREEHDVQPGAKAYGFQFDGIDHHQINEMRLNLPTATEIVRMDGVRGAYVMLTDRNAYVAIVTDDSATGTNGIGNAREKNDGSREELYREGNRPSYTLEIPTPYITEAHRQYTIPDPKNISSKLKQKIAVTVRSLHPEVQEVYISANREFNNLMHSYAQQSWLGRSLDPYVDQFQEVVKNHFIE